MLDAALFDKLEWLARHIRRDNRPFGGLQLVAAGDFLQLPPIGGGAGGGGDEGSGDGFDCGGGGGGGGGCSSFCFDAVRWPKVGTALLTTYY
jgi:hypothetical protein